MVIYSRDAEADRAFFRDLLGWPHVDAGQGWLVFRLPPAEVAVHPSAETVITHELLFMCEDLDATLGELRAKGVEPVRPVQEVSWGRVTGLRLPGGGEIGLYQPRHPRAAAPAPASGDGDRGDAPAYHDRTDTLPFSLRPGEGER